MLALLSIRIFRLEQFNLGEVAEAWRSVRVDAAGQFFVTVQTVEPLGNSVATSLLWGLCNFGMVSTH